jgi:hypothetical protein
METTYTKLDSRQKKIKNLYFTNRINRPYHNPIDEKRN